MPKVSVVMASRNPNPVMLKEAIDSVLGQTFQDFEFIFVDDGSEKPIEPIIRSISSDERIVIYRINPSGLGAALNYGINHAKGELIARIDDDDVALPSRLEKQVAYMDEHPEVSCIGTQMYYKYGPKIYPHPPFPINHENIVRQLANLHFSIGHTLVMYRHKCFDKIGGYRIAGGGQDLDLFLQLGTVGELANIDEYLGCYTLTSTGLSVVNPKKREAYMFALESALKDKGYEIFYDDMIKSIELLKNSGESMLKSRVMPFKRTLLIWMTMFLGKDIDNVSNLPTLP